MWFAVEAVAVAVELETFVEGQGFPGAVVVGDPTPVMAQRLGRPREDMGAPFWYFYDREGWTLVAVAEFTATGTFVTRAVFVEGAAAPPSAGGVRVGDPAARVTELYGPASPLDTTIAPPGMQSLVMIDLAGRETKLPDPQADFRDALFYPAIRTFFVLRDGTVARIGAVAVDPPLPIWLRAEFDPAQGVVVDPGVDAPTYVDATLHVPAPPPLERFQGEGFALDVPKGWTREGTTWTSPDGAEHVQVRLSQSAEKADASFDEQERAYARNQVASTERVPPPEFRAMIGADAARALGKQEPGQGKAGAPLRYYVLMTAKGATRLTIEVTRTASGAQPSPDGEALARGVMRSLRLE